MAWLGVCNASDVTNILASIVVPPQVVESVPCNTTLIGELPAGSNGLAGRVYLIDRLTFAVVGFSYDGEAIGMHCIASAGYFSLCRLSHVLTYYSYNKVLH